MTFIFLTGIKEFLEREVCSKIKLKRPCAEDAVHFELIPPVVTVGWPETQLTGEQARRRVPGIAIGIRESVADDGNNRGIPIQLGLIVYSTGTILEDGTLQPDTTGYWDLLNLMDVTVRAIMNAPDIGGMTLAHPEVRYRPDNEQYGDFWLGYIEFDLEGPAAPRKNEQELI